MNLLAGIGRLFLPAREARPGRVPPPARVQGQPRLALKILTGEQSPAEKRAAIKQMDFFCSVHNANQPLFGRQPPAIALPDFFKLLAKQPAATVAQVHTLWQEQKPEKNAAPIKSFLLQEGYNFCFSGRQRWELPSGAVMMIEEYYDALSHVPGMPYEVKHFYIGCEIGGLTFYY
ncbi:MAG: hypothetical protein JW873_07115 [Candidatus Saganbacteria bacterium]|nr:hypothetical protein [Candidatus Saganbacteria bacterium]